MSGEAVEPRHNQHIAVGWSSIFRNWLVGLGSARRLTIDLSASGSWSVAAPVRQRLAGRYRADTQFHAVIMRLYLHQKSPLLSMLNLVHYSSLTNAASPLKNAELKLIVKFGKSR
ncbi:MAG: hypothetical protein U1E70_24085 [Acetobacteraceae bacterium]